MHPLLLQATETATLNRGFERVQNSNGCAGVDMETIHHFWCDLDGNLNSLQQEMRSGTYTPLPIMKILVSKRNGEARGLSIPTVRDRVAQSAVLEIIEPLFDATFADCSYAYRKGRSVKQAVAKVQGYYDDGYRWVVDADIDAFFDNVDHNLLMEKVSGILDDKGIVSLIRKWITNEAWDGKKVAPTTRGIPQGSVISPILSNLFLDELDDSLQKKGYRIVRFSDDFIILCKKEEKAKDALELTKEILQELSLALDEADITHFDHGFTFLGVTFLKSMAFVPFERTKYEKKVLFWPPPMSMAAYLLKKKKGW